MPRKAPKADKLARMRFSLVLLFSLVAACAPHEDDSNAITPSNPQPMPPSSSFLGANEPAAEPSASAAPGPNQDTIQPTTIEVHNDCSDSVPIFIGDTPKFGNGTKTSMSGNSTTSYPRNGDGTLTLWIIDDHENGLASVHITKRMKRVEIGRSCRTLDAK